MKKEKTSKFIGVYFSTHTMKYVSKISYKNRDTQIGVFINETDAAIAYDKYISDNNIPDKKLNFPVNINEGLLEYKLIRLTKGYFAKVSNEDYDRVSAYDWHVKMVKRKHGNVFYAVRKIYNIDGSKTNQYLHRFIMGDDDPMIQIDHKDTDSLNDQRSNLRICTFSQNCWNQTPQKHRKSKYKGVSMNNKGTKYTASISFKRKKYHLGTFITQEEAAEAYNAKAIELFGEFVRPNVIEYD